MDLTEYMNKSIESIIRSALTNTFSNPLESAFLLQMLRQQKKASELRSRQEKAGHHIPPFLIASIASQCNLHCAGCYARANHSCCDEAAAQELSVERWMQIFHEALELGVSFVLLAGGEPLVRRDILESVAKLTNMIFPIFTNGTLLDTTYLDLFHQSRNLIPVLSIEGNKETTDSRRGEGTYNLLQDAMGQLQEKGIFYGASVTVTKQNLKQVTSDDFIDLLRQKGCKLVFYVEYVPAVPGTEKLAPDDDDRDFLANRQEELRSRFEEILFLSFPGDEKNIGGCLAGGRGFFHINARGGAEPCPFSPFSDINLKDHSLSEAIHSPLFHKLREKGLANIPHNGGCALFERQSEMKSLLIGDN